MQSSFDNRAIFERNAILGTDESLHHVQRKYQK